MTAQRLVILGGTGFVGSRLLPRLAADGHHVVVLSRNRERHRGLAVLPKLELRSADIYDPQALRRHLEGADAAINLVGILNESGRDSFARAHVELARLLVQACRDAGVPRLHQMSALKAGQGLSRYLKSRGETETVVKRSGLAWTLYQPSVIFGPGDGLVTRFAALLRRTPVLPLARPRARLAPTWVGDVTEAIARCVADPQRGRERSFELYGPQTLTLLEIVCAIRDAARLRTRILGLPDGLGRLQAQLAQWLPGKPFSPDNFLTLRTDSVGRQAGYAELGITPLAFTPHLAELLETAAPRHRRRDRHRAERKAGGE